MSCNQNIGEIIREYKNSIPLTLGKLSRMSGVSTSHLGRIETGAACSNELLILAGYLSPEPSVLSKEQSNELRAELVCYCFQR